MEVGKMTYDATDILERSVEMLNTYVYAYMCGKEREREEERG